jgi:ribonuclease Z
MSEEMLAYHTPTLDVAEIARDAHVKKLVLTHFVPWLSPNFIVESVFIRGMKKIYKGKIIVGRDRMTIKA